MSQVIVDLGCGDRKRTKGGILVSRLSKYECLKILKPLLGRDPTDAELQAKWNEFELTPVTGIDVVKTKQVDIQRKLGYAKIPMRDGSVDYVLAHDLVEHLPFVEGNLKPVAFLFDDVYRVLKNGGYFEIKVPMFSHYDSFKFFNPEHKSYWGTETIHMFASKFKFCGARLLNDGKQHILLVKYG